jgi:hypothetical protein
MVVFWSTEIWNAAGAAPDDLEEPSTPDHDTAMDTTFAPDDAWNRVVKLDEAQQLLSMRLYPAFASLLVDNAKTLQPAHNVGSRIICIGGDCRNMMVGMLEALHSVFEDLKLDQVLWRHIPCLAALLAALAGSVSLNSWKVRAPWLPC